MTRITRKLPITLVLSLVAGVGVAQADSKGTLIALRMPSHETRVRTNPLTQHPRELPARVTAELSTGFADERPIDIFSKRAIERVALHQPETDAVPAGVGNQIRFDCESIQREPSPQMDRTMRMWEDLGLLGESGCRELGEPDPVRDLTTWEKLARKYPPKKFDLWAGLKFQYERYPVGPVDADHLGDPLRRDPLGPVLRPLE